MSAEQTRLLHTWTGELTVLGVRTLAQACLYGADTVLIPASATVPEGVRDTEREFIQHVIGRLIDLGALARWGVDGVPGSSVIASAPAEIISSERYRALYDQGMDLLMDRRSLFLGGEKSSRFDGVTEVVVGKHAVMHTLLADELSAAAILHDQDSADGYARFLADLANPAGMVAQIAASIALELELPEASALPDELYEEARKKLSHFRVYILERLRDSGPILAGDAALEGLRASVVADVIGAYTDYAARNERKGRHRPWLRDLWRLRRLNGLGRAGQAEPLQVLYELKTGVA